MTNAPAAMQSRRNIRSIRPLRSGKPVATSVTPLKDRDVVIEFPLGDRAVIGLPLLPFDAQVHLREFLPERIAQDLVGLETVERIFEGRRKEIDPVLSKLGFVDGVQVAGVLVARLQPVDDTVETGREHRSSG